LFLFSPVINTSTIEQASASSVKELLHGSQLGYNPSTAALDSPKQHHNIFFVIMEDTRERELGARYISEKACMDGGNGSGVPHESCLPRMALSSGASFCTFDVYHHSHHAPYSA
jgi:hypothetical protein